MRELTKVERHKTTFQLEKGEFVKGEWLKDIVENDLLEISYTGNNRILVIKECNIKKGVEKK